MSKIYNKSYVENMENAIKLITANVENVKFSKVIDSKFSGPRSKISYKNGSTYMYFDGDMFIIGDKYQSYSGSVNDIIKYLNKNINHINFEKNISDYILDLDEEDSFYTKGALKIYDIIQNKMTDEDRLELYTKETGNIIETKDRSEFWDWIDMLDSSGLENLDIDLRYLEEGEDEVDEEI